VRSKAQNDASQSATTSESGDVKTPARRGTTRPKKATAARPYKVWGRCLNTGQAHIARRPAMLRCLTKSRPTRLTIAIKERENAKI